MTAWQGIWRIAATGAAAACLSSATAAADHSRTNVPAGLTGTVSTAHFKLHYNPSSTPPASTGMTISQYATAGAADFEESYSRLVSGGGGSPNAGLLAPIPDSDTRTDVYLAAPTTNPSFSGGTVRGDSHGNSSYLFMTPDLSRVGFRFRSAHEFMHVIQDAYTPGFGEGYLEAWANWAAEFSLPDVEPLDNRFAKPWLPIDCNIIPGTWEGESCGSGYGTWLFLQDLVEAYGADFVKGYYERFQGDTGISDATNLDLEIQAQSGNASSLGRRYASYARDVWEPARWTTTATASIHAFEDGPPAAVEVTRAVADTGTVPLTVDHLATRYVRVVNDGGFLPSGPQDSITVFVGRPAGLLTSSDFMMRPRGGTFSDTTGPSGGPGTGSFGTSFDPASFRDLVLPLTNDNRFTDDLGFSYRVVFERGTPTPPANDQRSGAGTAVATLGSTAQTDSVYAGGRGMDETPGTDCDGVPAIADATRGVWFRFTAPNGGSYTFDVSGSDFPSNVSVFRASDGAFAGCTNNESFTTPLTLGTAYDVMVARDGHEIDTGTIARLLVTGPPADTTPPNVSITGPSGTIADDTPTFGYSADEAATFACFVDAAPVTCSGPANSHTTAPLSNGPHTFEVRATDPSGNIGSATRPFTVQVQAPGGGSPGGGSPGGGSQGDAGGGQGTTAPAKPCRKKGKRRAASAKKRKCKRRKRR